MPSYSGKYRARWSSRRQWRYRRYAKRYARRYAKRFINGNSRSGVKVKIPVSFDVAPVVLANNRDSGCMIFHPFVDGSPNYNPGGAVGSALYRRYCDLYEEVKNVGMKLSFNIVTPIGVGGNPGCVVVTAVDRKWSVNEMAGAFPTVETLLSYSSASKYSAINNSVSKFVRRVYASDLQEKITYIDSDNETGNLTVNRTGPFQFQYNKAWQSGGALCPAFAPALFVGLRMSSAPAANTTYTIHVEGYFYYTFRNPKYGGSASAKGVDAVIRAAPELDGQPPSQRARVVFDEDTIDPDSILEQPQDHHPNE